jgi:hypothetical protein
MEETPSFPRKRETRSLKLLISINDWMPASAGMTNYDTASLSKGGIPLFTKEGEGEIFKNVSIIMNSVLRINKLQLSNCSKGGNEHGMAALG